MRPADSAARCIVHALRASHCTKSIMAAIFKLHITIEGSTDENHRAFYIIEKCFETRAILKRKRRYKPIVNKYILLI